jgi:hypothetical protein
VHFDSLELPQHLRKIGLFLRTQLFRRLAHVSEIPPREAATLLSRDPVAALYVATVLARRLDGANRVFIQLKSQLEAGSKLAHALYAAGLARRKVRRTRRRALPP